MDLFEHLVLARTINDLGIDTLLEILIWILRNFTNSPVFDVVCFIIMWSVHAIPNYKVSGGFRASNLGGGVKLDHTPFLKPYPLNCRETR